MAGRGAGKVSARDRARAARAKLDADRAARDRRIEESATAYYVALEAREAAEEAAREAESSMAAAVAALLGEGESVERVAALCEITDGDVRRLRRLAAADEPRAVREQAPAAADAAPDLAAGPGEVPAQPSGAEAVSAPPEDGADREVPAPAYA